MHRVIAAFVLTTLLSAACTGPLVPAPTVVSVTLSHGLAPDYRPLSPTEHFAPDEAFYCAALMRDLRPNVVVSARWLYQGQLIKRTDYVVQQTGNGYVGFELTKEQPPWPTGVYSVEILVNHERAGSASFSVP